jgi:hypothetical protein
MSPADTHACPGAGVGAVTLAPTAFSLCDGARGGGEDIAMRVYRSWPGRLTLVASAILMAVALASSSGLALAAPPQAFTLTPSVVEFEATTDVQSFDFEFVMVGTGPRWLVYSGPASTTGDPVFFDTQAGSCWQQYEALGKRIPGKTTCTIQVGFHSTVAGTFTGKLVVFRCLDWHEDPISGVILCDVLDGSQSIDLVGTAVQA